MRVSVLAVVVLLSTLHSEAGAQSPDAAVRTGIDVLVASEFKQLDGKRVGLITNPTGITHDLRSTVDVLHQAANVELVALFGPEHGVRGEAHAGAAVEDSRDATTGVPTYSLYGKNRKPTAEMLEGIDTLVFDIQDIGSRSYTYISTMAVAMEAAAEHGRSIVVLDRPNPLTGTRVEGRVLDFKYKSFVGYLPIPYVHGMTVGELAHMINGEGWLEGGGTCDLQVIPMTGWKRAMWFDETGLTWVPTSPHVPRSDSALYYAATGIMGELHVISEGVGYTLPFELAGAPWTDPHGLSEVLNSRRMPGVFFRPMYYRPYYATYSGETVGGVQILFSDRDKVHLTGVQFHIMDAVARAHPDRKLFGGKRDRMFDKVCGTDLVRRMFLERRPIKDIMSFWGEGTEDFRKQRQPYLLYE